MGGRSGASERPGPGAVLHPFFRPRLSRRRAITVSTFFGASSSPLGLPAPIEAAKSDFPGSAIGRSQNGFRMMVPVSC